MKVPVLGRIIGYFDKVDNTYTGQQLYDETMKPRRVVVNGGGAREVYNKDNDSYRQTMLYIDSVIAQMKNSAIQCQQMLL